MLSKVFSPIVKYYQKCGRFLLRRLMILCALVFVLLLYQFSRSETYFYLSEWLSFQFRSTIYESDSLKIEKKELKYNSDAYTNSLVGDFSGTGEPVVIEQGGGEYTINSLPSANLNYTRSQPAMGWSESPDALIVHRTDQDFLLRYNSLMSNVSLYDAYAEKILWSLDLPSYLERHVIRMHHLATALGTDPENDVFVVIDGVYGRTLFLNGNGEKLFELDLFAEAFDRLDIDGDGVEEIAMLIADSELQIYTLEGNLIKTLDYPSTDRFTLHFDLIKNGDQFEASVLTTSNKSPANPHLYFNRSVMGDIAFQTITWNEANTTIKYESVEQTRLKVAKEFGAAVSDGHFLFQNDDILYHIGEDGEVIDQHAFQDHDLATGVYYDQKRNRAYISSAWDDTYLIEISFK